MVQKHNAGSLPPRCATVLRVPHLFTPLQDPLALGDYRRRLAAAHDAVAQAAAAHGAAATVDTVDHWGSAEKRRPVDLSELAKDDGLRGMIGVSSQPFGEIVNQLATVERLLDALSWSEGNGAERVVECNPSTSRGPTDTCSHDLVVADSDTTMVFEVSDVAGDDGNANRKMEKDLFILDRCACGMDSSVRRLLAVSPRSGRWLEARPQLATVVAADRLGNGTWIAEASPTPSG